MNAAVTEMRGVLARLDQQIDPAGEKLNLTLDEAQKTLASFNATATTLRRFVSAQQNLGEGANQAFSRLSEAADAIQRLADFLERNPQALLSGRPRPE
jgi:paraquat-inducible protein B